MKEIIISADQSSQRFDKYLKRVITGESSGFIYKMLRKKNITLNGKKADGTEILSVGDSVKFFFSDDTFEKVTEGKLRTTVGAADGVSAPNGKSEGMPIKGKSVLKNLVAGVSSDINVVSEDDDILIINKPIGVLSQKATGGDISINEMALSYLYEKNAVTEESYMMFHPSVVNRIDRNTSGLILFGKTLKGSQYLSKLLSDRDILKLYRCVVKGRVDKETVLKGYLKKDEATNRVVIKDNPFEDAKYIETGLKPVAYSKDGLLTLCEVHLITGKSHQIRAHLAHIGHPLVGDYKYGDKAFNDGYKAKYKIMSQLLHSYRIVIDENNDLVAPMPKIYDRLMQ